MNASDKKIIAISKRINRASSAIDLAISNAARFALAGCTDLREHTRRIGIRRARLGMLTYALRLEAGSTQAA